MIGSWRWNLIAATALGLLIFLLSFPRNPMETTFYRTAVSFAVAFCITYAVRFLIGRAVEIRAEEAGSDGDETGDDGKGRVIDMTTPDSVHEPPEEDAEFTPLQPPKLVRTDKPLSSEEMAQVVRHMSNDEG